MPKIVDLAKFDSQNGNLTVIEGLIPGNIRRVYYITNVPKGVTRGGHRHKITWQALICIKGSCRVFVDDNTSKEYFELDSPARCLLLEPQDWHTMDNFSEDAILLVMANEIYDVNDYIDEPYS